MKPLQFILIAMLTIILSNLEAQQRKTKTVYDTIYSNIDGKGIELIVEMTAGKAHNHPTFVIWVEDMEENYIQTLFVTRYIATGIFGYGPVNDSVWGNQPGEAYRPAALPYWNHKRTAQPEHVKVLPTPDNRIPDAYTGATPPASFVLKTRTDNPYKSKYRLLIEINQTWDWNEYWTNHKFPNDIHYKTSSQPSVVYAVTIEPDSDMKEHYLNPIGHGHYAGRDGRLYTDLSTLTTALEIIKSIKVSFK